MPAIVRLPRVSDHIEQAKLLRWLVAEGEGVTAGASLAEIEFDKATVELEAESTGRLAAVITPAGAIVTVGAAVAAIALDGEDLATVRERVLRDHPPVPVVSGPPRAGLFSRLFGLRS